MSSINRWLTEVPTLKNRERLLSILYTLGVATREQLAVITGWTPNYVRDRIRELRDQVPIPEHHKIRKQMLAQAKEGENITDTDLQKLAAKVAKEAAQIERGRNSWVTIIQPEGGKGISYYTLGGNGVNLAKEIRREFVKKNTMPKPKSQVDHFFGTNEVLCRLRRRGIMETDWMSSGEIMQDLYYYWNREHAGKGIPYRPDAYLQMNEDRYYIEFDTGSESNGRLRTRFSNCLNLYNSITDPQRNRLPNNILWVCRTPQRKQRIEQIATEILHDFQLDRIKKRLRELKLSETDDRAKVEAAAIISSIRIPTSYCLLQDDDTRFLLGEIDPDPFWVG